MPVCSRSNNPAHLRCPYKNASRFTPISFRVHGKIDPFNVADFALQTLAPPLCKQKKAGLFNLVFTALAATVLLTDWKKEEWENPYAVPLAESLR